MCKTATCTKYPDAKCVSPMGGCGAVACKPKFYDSMGNQVQCEYGTLFLNASESENFHVDQCNLQGGGGGGGADVGLLQM